MLYKCLVLTAVCMEIFKGTCVCFVEQKSESCLFFTDQVEYIVSLSHCFFLRIKNLRSLQAYSKILKILHPLKISACVIYMACAALLHDLE